MKVSCSELFKGQSNSEENLIISKKEKLIAEINILLGENVEFSKSVIKSANELFFELMKPTNFNLKSAKNVFEEREETFEKLCLSMEKYGAVTSPKKYTVYEFYKRIEVIQENVRINKRQ